MYSGKSILITGGTGSLGKALTKHIIENFKYIKRLVIFSRDEQKQFQMAQEFPESKYPFLRYFIGDVRDKDRLIRAFKGIDFVIHAAAMKHVHIAEYNPDECVKTNINGSENVARAALDNNIKKCILVSTDKACQPVNVYGSSKFIAERIFTNYDYHSNSTVFASVRYGNVIASRGSFIPLFMDWINDNQTIRVTSEEMTRFLFTLEDAVDAVLGALQNAYGGEVFVPQINSYTLPTCIKALEKITNKKANTELMGLRPGEKLHEDMLAETELPFTYQVPNINLLQIRPQYTDKKYQDFKKYNGPHFNSALWVKEDISELVKLINKGLQC